MKREHDLLLAVSAVQLGYASAQDVLACARDLLKPQEQRGLLQLLAQRRLLHPRQRALLESLADRATRDAQGPEGAPAPTPAPDGSANTTAPAAPVVHPPAGPEVVHREAEGQYTPLRTAEGTPVELGRGGVGTVTLAHDNFLGREVAFKQLRLPKGEGGEVDPALRADLEARFLREARLAGQLEHPVVIPVYELGRRPSGELYYSMMRVRGRTLAEAFSEVQGQRMSVRLRLVRPFLAVCQGLAHAHARGVVHRDVKPANVMLGEFGEVFLVDWGLARMVNADTGELKLAPDLTGSGNFPAGTPRYMSPEQAEGRIAEVDERSDVWNLGAVLFELICGRAPFEADDPVRQLEQVRSQEPPSVRSLAPRAPLELAAICEKALRRDRAHRYANAEEMARDLKAFLAGTRVRAHDYSSLELVRRYLRRRRLSALLGLLAVLTIALVTAYGLRQVRQQRDQARHFAELFLDDVAGKLAPAPGLGEVVENVSALALQHFERTHVLEQGTHEDRQRVALAFARLGGVQLQLGRLEDARRTLQFARSQADALRTDRDDADARYVLALTLEAQADTRLAQNASHREALLYEALAQLEPSVSAQTEDADSLELQSRVLRAIGMLSVSHSPEQAITTLNRAVETAEKAHRLRPTSVTGTRCLSQALASLAQAQRTSGRPGSARSSAERAAQLGRDVLTNEPTNAVFVLEAAERLVELAEILEANEAPNGQVAAEALQRLAPLDARRTTPPEVLAVRARAQAASGQYRDAMRSVLALDSSHRLEVLGPQAAEIALLAAEPGDAFRLGMRPSWETEPTALLYRTLGAALLGRPGDALVPARSLLDRVSQASWRRGHVLAMLPPTPEAAPVRTLAEALDAHGTEPREARRAWAAFIATLEAQLPPR